MRLFDDVQELKNDPALQREHEKNVLLYGSTLSVPYVNLTNNYIENWAKRLTNLSQNLSPQNRITLEYAEEIAHAKLEYFKKEIIELEKKQVTQPTKRRESIIADKYHGNPFAVIKSEWEALNIIEAHDRHANTDYDERLAEGQRLMTRTRGQNRNGFYYKDYARRNSHRYSDAKYLEIKPDKDNPDCYRVTRLGNEMVAILPNLEKNLFASVDMKQLTDAYMEEQDAGRGACHGFAIKQAQAMVTRINDFLENNLKLNGNNIVPLNKVEVVVATEALIKIYDSALVDQVELRIEEIREMEKNAKIESETEQSLTVQASHVQEETEETLDAGNELC